MTRTDLPARLPVLRLSPREPSPSLWRVAGALAGVGALLLFFPVLFVGAVLVGAALGIAAYFALKAAELLGWLSRVLARASAACRGFYARHIGEDR